MLKHTENVNTGLDQLLKYCLQSINVPVNTSTEHPDDNSLDIAIASENVP